MKVNKIKSYIPEGLEIPADIPFADGIRQLISTIYWHQLEQRLRWDQGVYLKYDYLRSNIPDWKKVWDWSRDNGVVERVGGYAVGDHSYAYRLTERYRGRTHRLVAIEAPAIAKRLRRASERFRTRPVLLKLCDCLNRISIDLEQFESLCQDHPERDYYQAHINTMVWRDWRFVEDDFSNRIHTNITNLYKPLRSLLRVDGGNETLSEIDIPSSQPLFLGMEAQRSGARDEDYLRLCSEGRIYDIIGWYSGMVREGGKKEFLKFLFAKNGFHSQAKMVFAKIYPSIASYINKIKEKDHHRIARCLQKAERRFVIDTVCQRLFRERPGVFLTTVHDSILCQRSDGLWVRDVMLDEFQKRGVSPSLRVVEL
jgi:hypothetical protein